MNELHIAALIDSEREGRRIKEFIEDPVIKRFFDRIEAQGVEKAINAGSHDEREAARVHVLVVRDMRAQLKLAVGRAVAAASELAKTKEKK